MNSRLLAIDDLTAGQRRAMHALLGRHFENVTRDQFESDLEAKNWVILLQNASGLCGFTTIRFFIHDGPYERCCVVVSGDTIVDPQAWGSSALLRAWLHGVLSLRKRANGAGPCYWLLITSGFRTYRFLPLFWRVFYPRYDTPTPPRVQRQLDDLAQATYGDAYDASTGIVHLPRPQRLRSHLAGIPDARRNDPHIDFFVQRNPGHWFGDELVSLTEIDELNLTRAGQRILRSRMPSRNPHSLSI